MAQDIDGLLVDPDILVLSIFGRMHPDADQVWAAINAIYTGFLAGDRDAIDAHLSPEATIWDSEHAQLVRGKAELDALRDTRPANGPAPTRLDASEPVIDVFGDVALVRHVLVAGFAGRAEQRIRNTSVWRRVHGRWLCIHNHEDVVS
jgi:ketosteroid isomerase-like protein